MGDRNDATQPPAAATGVASAPGDETVAQHFHAIQVLVDLYGFPSDVAAGAVEAVGIDPGICIAYILDQQLAPDTGGPVVPRESCPHIPKQTSNDDSSWRKNVMRVIQNHQSPSTMTCAGPSSETDESSKPSVAGAKREESPTTTGGCGVTGEVWICLHCGGIFCSRYQQGHAVDHHTACPDHAVHVSVSDLSVWCHNCSAYIATHSNPILNEVVSDLETWKFGPSSDKA